MNPKAMAGMSLSLVLIVMFMWIKRRAQEIIILLLLIPLMLSVVLSQFSFQMCGSIGFVLSIASNLAPLEKIVRNRSLPPFSLW